MTDSRTLIDSNILVYSVDSSEDGKHRRARELMNEMLEKGFFLSVQNLTEFYAVSTQKIETPMEHEAAMSFIQNLKRVRQVKIASLGTDNLSKGAEISERNGTDYWDSLIAAVMKENNVEKIYTENTEDFEEITGIEPENPFE